MYFCLLDIETGVRIELPMFIKQAQQVMMYCQNDFRKFVAEMLCVKIGKVTLRNIN
jgi:hypothetical protein